MIDYFLKFNQCSGDEIPDSRVEPKRKSVNLKLVLGAGPSTLNVRNLDTRKRYNKKFADVSYHAGIEAEFILPFNKNKWAIMLGSSLNSFESTEGSDAWGNEAKIRTVELALGPRHYFFFNKDSKIFLDAMMVGYFPGKKNDIEYLNLKAQFITGLAFGAGFNYKSISAEVRYYPNHNVIPGYSYWTAPQMKGLLIFGYQIF